MVGQNHRLKTVLSYAAEEDLAATLSSALSCHERARQVWMLSNKEEAPQPCDSDQPSLSEIQKKKSNRTRAKC